MGVLRFLGRCVLGVLQEIGVFLGIVSDMRRGRM
jgi:hypothetical protein